MSKRRIYFHLILALAALIVGVVSIWETGWMVEGKNYPNLTAIAMVLLIFSQVAMLFAGVQREK